MARQNQPARALDRPVSRSCSSPGVVPRDPHGQMSRSQLDGSLSKWHGHLLGDAESSADLGMQSARRWRCVHSFTTQGRAGPDRQRA